MFETHEERRFYYFKGGDKVNVQGADGVEYGYIQLNDFYHEIERAKVSYNEAKKAQYSISHFDEVKNNPEYMQVIKKYRIDKLNIAVQRLCML